GGRPARVLVDDVALARLVDRRDDREGDVLLGRALAQPLEQRRARDRLVRDDEHMGHRAPTSFSSACLAAPPMTACRAPGTPYSYGPPTTCGISSKLKIGGGEETCHSSVIDRHGFGSAFRPRIQLSIML